MRSLERNNSRNDGSGRPFTLRARADRIEARRDGRWGIIDFKTGQAPTSPQVQTGLAPQLALEGQRWGERGPTTAGTCG